MLCTFPKHQLRNLLKFNANLQPLSNSRSQCRKFFQLKSQVNVLSGDAKKITPLGWFLLAIPATTFGLGCWQVQRKAWKENLIKQLGKSMKEDPVPFPENLDDLATMEYQPVSVRGQFLHNKEIYLGPRSFIRADGEESRSGLFSQPGESIGYLVITPFKLTGREETILVNRGWVPKKLLKPETRKQGQIEGEVEITAIVRREENRPQFTPDHRGDIYLYRDLTRMCAQTGADPIFVEATYESSIPGGPIGGQTRAYFRNEHLSYIITWYSLSAATLVLWYTKIVKRRAF